MSVLKPIELLIKKVTLLFLNVFRRKGLLTSISIDKDLTYKILFIRPEKIGDIFVTFPVFDILLKQFPNVKISVLGSHDCKPIFYKIYYYQKNVLLDFRELKKIRNERYDCVVDLVGCDSVTSLLLTTLGVPKKPRIAIGKDRFSQYYDINFDLRYNNTGHVITNILKLETLTGEIRKKFLKKFNEKIVEGNAKAVKRAYEEVIGE